MKKFDCYTIPQLQALWEAKRAEIARKGAEGIKRGDMGELFEIRKALDRRRGELNPSTDIDYEQYLTD